MYPRYLFALLLLFFSNQINADTPVIAVASNMSFAAEALGKAFTDETGQSIKLSFGSSGNLTRQILQGAPYELFIAADASYTQRLYDEGKTLLEPVAYAEGKLCLFIPKKSSFNNIDNINVIISKLTHGQFNKLAIANPELAPYGRASVAALQRVGVWALDNSKLVLGENVSQTTHFTLSGSVDAGFIPYSHAIMPNIKTRGKCLPVPDDWHKPIVQEMALLNNAGETAKLFFSFLTSDSARKLLLQYGYTLLK